MINKLAKNYDKLSPAERFSLIIAASSRGDEQERAALEDSAPRRDYRVVDFYGQALGFSLLAMNFVLEQLSFGCMLLWASYLGNMDDSKGDIWPMVEELAGAYCSHAEAWRLFCAENNISPAGLIGPDYPGYDVMVLIDKLAGAIAEPDDIDPNPYLEGLRSSLAKLAERWG